MLHWSLSTNRLFSSEYQLPFILTDDGLQFVTKLFTAHLGFLGVKQLTATAYHQQTNGQTEWYNKMIAARWWQYGNEHPLNWDIFIEAITYAFNRKLYWSTGMTPSLLKDLSSAFPRDAFPPITAQLRLDILNLLSLMLTKNWRDAQGGTKPIQTIPWWVGIKLYNLTPRRLRIHVRPSTDNPENISRANGRRAAIETLAESRWSVSNYGCHTAQDHNEWSMYLERDINRQGDSCPTAEKSPQAEYSIHNAQSDKAPPDSMAEVTGNKMHPSREHAPPAREAADSSDFYVLGCIVGHNNTKDGTRCIVI